VSPDLTIDDLAPDGNWDALGVIDGATETTSKTERILQAVEALLAGTAGVPGTRVWRERAEPASREECPFLNIVAENEPHENDEQGVLPFVDASLLLQIEIGINGRPLSALADPIRVDVHQRLMADRSLGGLSSNIHSVGVGWDSSPGEIGIARLRYLVKFRTWRDDLKFG
jgi:hypothetical protein